MPANLYATLILGFVKVFPETLPAAYVTYIRTHTHTQFLFKSRAGSVYFTLVFTLAYTDKFQNNLWTMQTYTQPIYTHAGGRTVKAGEVYIPTQQTQQPQHTTRYCIGEKLSPLPWHSRQQTNLVEVSPYFHCYLHKS